MDYEQLYYDALYEIKQLNLKIEELSYELYFIKNSKDKNLKRFIAKEIFKHKKQKKEVKKKNDR